MELQKKLLSIGFTPNQAKVYTTLIDTGQTKVGLIIKRTGFHRNIIYRALDDLISKKLVTKITKSKISYYSAIDPEPILLDIKHKEDLAKSIIKEVKLRHKKNFSEVIILQGKQGVTDLINLIIQEGVNIYGIGENFNIAKIFNEEQLGSFKKRAIDKGIKHYSLLQAHFKDSSLLHLVEDAHTLPKTFPSSPLVIWIFGKVVAQILWEDTETIFIIKNKNLADNYKEYFKLLWNQSSQHPKVKKTAIPLH